MYKFTVKNASFTAENPDTGMKAIISCYGLHMDDDYTFTDDDEATVKKFVEDHMKLCAEILVWNDNEKIKGKDARKLFSYFESLGAGCTVWLAENKDHFESWFTEHEKFLATIKELGYNTLICRDSDKSMWVQRAYPLTNDLGAWIIVQMLPNGVIERMFKTRANFPGGGNWYECVRRQKMMTDRFKRLKEKGVF